MNCSEWYTCMSQEQWNFLWTQIFTIGGAFTVFIVFLLRFLQVYVPRIMDNHEKSKEQRRELERLKTETELQNQRTEVEVEAQQALALPEAFVKTTTMLGQVLERHAVVDEQHVSIARDRNAIDKQRIESDKQQMETLNRLANSIGDLNRSINTSQTWQEARLNERIDADNEYNLRMGNVERTLDQLVKDFTEARDKIIIIHATTAQQSTLLAIESGLASVKLMLESLVPKAPDLGNRQPIEADVLKKLDDTLQLSEEDMLEATRVFPDDSDTPTNQSQEIDSQPNLPKAS